MKYFLSYIIEFKILCAIFIIKRLGNKFNKRIIKLKFYRFVQINNQIKWINPKTKFLNPE